MRKNVVLFMMAGSGTRFGGEVPKQFYLIDDKPVFVYILEQLNKIPEIDEIVVITNPSYYEYTKEWIIKNNVSNIYKVIPGGEGRSVDVFSGLETVKSMCDDNDNILMYDATHPFVDREGFVKVIHKIDEVGAATLAEYQYDTTYMIDEETNTIKKVIPRREVIAGASPEGFKFKTIYNIYYKTPREELNSLTSAGAIALENGLEMEAVKTDVVNLKITYQNDMEVVKKLIKHYVD